MYYSSFFVGGFAIHGYASVPPYPASHGCVRIPLWVAYRVFSLIDYGTRSTSTGSAVALAAVAVAALAWLGYAWWGRGGEHDVAWRDPEPAARPRRVHAQGHRRLPLAGPAGAAARSDDAGPRASPRPAWTGRESRWS
jgi:hypothetical protein